MKSCLIPGAYNRLSCRRIMGDHALKN